MCGSNTFNRFKSNSFLQVGCSACMEGDVCTNDRCLIQGEDWAAYRVRYYFLLESFFTLNIMGQKNIGIRTRINFMYISE